jgi:hypothetical protein
MRFDEQVNRYSAADRAHTRTRLRACPRSGRPRAGRARRRSAAGGCPRSDRCGHGLDRRRARRDRRPPDEPAAGLEGSRPTQRGDVQGYEGAARPPGGGGRRCRLDGTHVPVRGPRRRLRCARGPKTPEACNTAQADAFIACWNAKFTYWSERPVTAIRRELDPSWLSYIATPPFPSYVSGHSSTSGAASRVLAAYFRDAAPQLRAWAEEAAVSRL